MITIEQEQFIRDNIKSEFFNEQNIIDYLRVHDVVGPEIFNLSYDKKGTELDDWSSEEFFKTIDTDTFIRRIPFIYFYQQGNYLADADYTELVGLNTFFKVFIEDYIYRDPSIITGIGDLEDPDYEPIFKQLEKLYYDYGISIDDIFQYPQEQSGEIYRFDVSIMWWSYIELCVQNNRSDFCPSNLLYAFDKLIEETGNSPLIFRFFPTEKEEAFIRDGDEIIIEGEFPTDDAGNVVLKWCGIWIENSKYIKTVNSREAALKKKIHIGLTNYSKIYLLNLKEDYDEDYFTWFPIYTGPRVMEFDPHALKESRINRDKTQKEVAEAADVTERTYQKWEAGDAKPDGYNLIRIMNFLDISDVQFIVKSEEIYDPDYKLFLSRDTYC